MKRQWAVGLPGEARRPGVSNACTLIGRLTSLHGECVFFLMSLLLE